MENTTMDNFCGSVFWDTNLTWNTDKSPDFTPCFENTVLIWTPCLFLWIFSIFEAFYLTSSKRRNTPWSWQLVMKSFITILLIILSLVDLGMAVFNSFDKSVAFVEYFTPAIKFITFLLAGVILYNNKKFGMRTSGLLFFFWFLLAFFGAARLRTQLMSSYTESEDKYSYISYFIYYSAVLIMFLLQFKAEGPPKFSEYREDEHSCPEKAASFPSRLFFTWFDPLTWKGFKKPLETSDLWSMSPEDKSKEVFLKFDKFWSKKLRKSKSNIAGSSQKSFDQNELNNKNGNTNASIITPLFKAFGGKFLFGSFLLLLQVFMAFINPQVVELLINFVGKPDEPMWKGYLYAVLFLMTAIVGSLIATQHSARMFTVGLRARTSLIAAIYRKSLRMSNTAKKESTVGEIVNLMSIDAQRFMELTPYINLVWSAPLQVTISIYFLWELLGISIFAGLLVMIIVTPINGFIAKKSKDLLIKQMKNKDERVKLTNEILNGVKVLKLYAWEPTFEEKILEIRKREMNLLKKSAYLNGGTSFIWICTPVFVSLVTFATFVLIDEKNVLNSVIIFKALSLFNILQAPLAMFPMMISSLVLASVSVKRINAFMNTEEMDPNNVQHDENEPSSLIIENGNFSWNPEVPEMLTLRNINLKVDKGQLVAVVGTVGSGKSSLISAFLGEMDRISGRVNTKGSIAFVSQQAWIQNATIQDNILFGKKMDKKLYKKVIKACELSMDLEMCPAGDQTEIGEKGINLSGGQKQRVAIARAVYNDSDVYFFDDPLSAVDSHVGKNIFDNVIGPNGLLKGKTRVLVTHGITYLPEVDNIVVLKDGEVSETGTYNELLEKQGAFSDFLIQHISKVTTEDVGIDIEEIKQQLESKFGAKEIQRNISNSASDKLSENRLEARFIEDPQSPKALYHRHKSISYLQSESMEEFNSLEMIAGKKLIQAEKAETGSVKLAVYAHYLKSFGLLLVIVVLFMHTMNQVFGAGMKFWLSKWADDNETYVNGHADEGKRNTYIGVYALLGLGQGIMVVAMSISFARGGILASMSIFTALLKRVFRAPLSFFDTTPIGRILNRFGQDTDIVDVMLPRIISSWLTFLFQALSILVVISYSTPIFTTVIIPITILYYSVQRFYVTTSRQLKRLESSSRSPIYSHFSESLAGAPTIRAYGEPQRFIRESDEKLDLNQMCSYPGIMSDRWLQVRLEIVGNLVIFFAALFVALSRETLEPGLAGLSITSALQITIMLNLLVLMTSELETNIVAVERMKEYSEITQEASWENSSTTPPKNWPENGCVEFRNVKIRYREGLEFVLKGVSFIIHEGEKIGIVGRTGAGKSSLTLGLFRIVEAAEGQVLIDGIDISKLGLHNLRSKLTIIPQDPVLFSGSMRMNLDPSENDTDENIWRALESAHLKQFVESLPQGLQHEVSEGGDNLSVGQRQLICLARALLRKTKILILDEATAAVDLETDDLIQLTIREEFKNCTVLTIAHRLNTIIDSDRLIVLDNGNLVEFDSPQALLRKSDGTFYSMAKDAGLI